MSTITSYFLTIFCVSFEMVDRTDFRQSTSAKKNILFDMISVFYCIYITSTRRTKRIHQNILYYNIIVDNYIDEYNISTTVET